MGDQRELRESHDDPAVPGDASKLWNVHGYGFQYALLRTAQRLFVEGKSRWEFEAAEFPVGEERSGTHIDFILEDAQWKVFLVAECKRADPARSSWCFVHAPATWPGAQAGEVFFQSVYGEAETR